MECRSVLLAKQMLNSKANVVSNSLLEKSLSQGDDGEAAKFSLSPFRWILRSIGPSSLFYRWCSLNPLLVGGEERRLLSE